MEKLRSIHVRDVMSRGVMVVPMDDSVRDVAKILVEEHIHGLVVVSPDEEIMGVISEIDIVKAFKGDWDKLTAEDIMTPHVRTIRPEMTLADAAEIMSDLNIHRLVVKPGVPGHAHDIPVGILCASDILKAAIE